MPFYMKLLAFPQLIATKFLFEFQLYLIDIFFSNLFLKNFYIHFVLFNTYLHTRLTSCKSFLQTRDIYLWHLHCEFLWLFSKQLPDLILLNWIIWVEFGLFNTHDYNAYCVPDWILMHRTWLGRTSIAASQSWGSCGVGWSHSQSSQSQNLRLTCRPVFTVSASALSVWW